MKVTDSSNNGLSNVHIVLSNSTNEYEGTTGSAGGCTLRNVKTGSYEISATKNGYKDYANNITVDKETDTLCIVMEESSTELLPTSIFGLDVNRATEYIGPSESGNNKLPSYQCLVVDEDMIPIIKPVTVTFDGESYDLTPDSKGICEFDLQGVDPGEYTITVDFAGDSTYEASSTTNSIKIFANKRDAANLIKIYNNIPDFEQPVGDSNGVQVAIGDVYGNPAEATFLVNGVEYVVPDDQVEGDILELDISGFSAGTYHFIIYHKGNSDIHTANSNIKVVTGVLVD